MGGKKNRPKTKWRKVSIGNDTTKGEDQSTTELEEERESSEDNSTIKQNGDSESQNYDENGYLLTNGSEEQFEHLPIFQQTPAGLIHIPQNGFFPFPVVAHPTSVDETIQPLAEALPPPPEGCVGGCYVNGLWIPNSELFKYGINPPPSTLSSTLVYHPNVPWVRLRPVPGPPPGGHHHNHRHHHHPHNHHHQNHHAHHHQHPPTSSGTPPVGEEVIDHTSVPPPPVQVPSIAPNAQYLLYFTRKPPPWYQNHPRERGDHNWRRRGSNGVNNPSPYWSFNHASVHHQQLHQQAQLSTMEQCLWNGNVNGAGGAEEFGALSRYNENLPVEDQLAQQVTTLTQQQCNQYEPAPYIYPGYSFGQPVFTAPVFPVSKSASESRSSRESPATTRSDGESSGAGPQETSSSPASSSSRPSLSSVGVTEVNTKEGSEPPAPLSTPTLPKEEELTPNSTAKEESSSPKAPTPVPPEAVNEELVEPSSTSSLLLATSQSSVPTGGSSPESNPAQRSKKKKKRKKTRHSNEMDKVAETPSGLVNGLPSSDESNISTAVKPDSLDLKPRDQSPPKICSAKLTNGELPNFKIDLAGPSRRSSTDEDDSSRGTRVTIVSQPFMEFADNLLRSTLEMARKEIADLHQSGSDRETIPSDRSLRDEMVPKAIEGNVEPASTLASTLLGLNTKITCSPEIEHGCTVSVEGRLSNLESNVRGTFAEKLAERVIRDSRQECRQIGHGPEPLSLPVAGPASIASTVSFSPKIVDQRREEDVETTATVEEDSSSNLERKANEIEGSSSSVEGKLIGLIEADATSSQFSRLHSLVRPDSRSLISSSNLEDSRGENAVENSEPTSSPPDLVDSLSNDGNGRFPRHEYILDAPPPSSLDSSHSIDYESRKTRVLEEFADRMLYEIAVKIREELVGGLGNEKLKENADVPFDGGDALSWADDAVIDDRTRRSSRDFDSLGSEFNSDRRFSVDSYYHGGSKYVDEATANYLAHLLPPSETLIRETEQELNSLQNRVRMGNAANHSIYKLAYDEVVTDPSDSEASPYTSLTSAQGEQQQQQEPEVNHSEPRDGNREPPGYGGDDPILGKDFLPQRFEILVHEADSMSEAGSEDVELIPHRYESGTTGEKHIYVNKLSLATELLRTKEELPYDEEFKPVTEEPGKSGGLFRGDHRDSPVKRGKTNEGFVGDEMPLSVITSGPRASTMSTADSGVQSEEEESGDEVAEEAIEGQKDRIKDATTSEEPDQGQGQESQGYRRKGAKTARLGTIPGGGPWDPCLCCCVM